MVTVHATNPNQARFLRLAVGLALIVSLTYVLMAAGRLAVGDLQLVDEAGTIVYVAAASYLIGGLLILARRRWLWIVGAVINALVILFFINLYRDRPEVLFSPSGLISKAAQLLLEATLISLIVTDWLRARRGT